MSTFPSVASPFITTMIRLDHSHVMAALHRYRADLPVWRKKAIVTGACAALEIHVQLEEEIFYPAVSAAAPEESTTQKSVPEHDAMRATIADIRAAEPGTNEYDALFMSLMRIVLHHVADEETQVLPRAEAMLADRLRELGSRMTRRRLELLTERPAEIAISTAGTFPLATFAIATALVMGVAHLGKKRATRL